MTSPNSISTEVLNEVKTVLTDLGYPKFFSILKSRKKNLYDLTSLTSDQSLALQAVDPEALSETSTMRSLVEGDINNKAFLEIDFRTSMTSAQVHNGIIKALNQHSAMSQSPYDKYINYDQVIYDIVKSGTFDIIGLYDNTYSSEKLMLFLIDNYSSKLPKVDEDFIMTTFTDLYVEGSTVSPADIDVSKVRVQKAIVDKLVKNAQEKYLTKGDLDTYVKYKGLHAMLLSISASLGIIV